MYRLLFLTFVFGSVYPLASSTTFYQDEADHAEHLRQARNELQSHFDQWLSRKLRERSQALSPVTPHPAAFPDRLSINDASAATQSQSRSIAASQPQNRGVYASQAGSAGAYGQPSVRDIPSFKDLSTPHGHGFFHLFHLHRPNGDQESWNHNDDQDFSYLFQDKPSWPPCPNPPCNSPVKPPQASTPPEYLPKPVYSYPSLPAYNPYQPDYDFYPDPSYSQQQLQPGYPYQTAYNPHQYPPSNLHQEPQPAPYPYQQYYPVYQYPATKLPVYPGVPSTDKYPQYQYDKHRLERPQTLQPVQIMNKPASTEQLPSKVPLTTNSTTTPLPYVTAESTTGNLAASTEEYKGTATEVEPVTLTVAPSINADGALVDVLEVTSSTPIATTSSPADEMELVGSGPTLLPALLDLRGVVTTEAPITAVTEDFYRETTPANEDASSSRDPPTRVPHTTESVVSTTETVDDYSSIVEDASTEFTAKPTQRVSTEVPLLPEVTEESTVSGTDSTTEVPVYTTTVEMGSTPEGTVSPYAEITEKESSTGIGYTASTVKLTTQEPVYSTTVEATEETDLPYEKTTEGRRTTLGGEYTPSTVEEGTEVPVYTTTMKAETEETTAPYEETTEKSQKTTVSSDYVPSTVEVTTDQAVYTTTAKIETEKTVSPYEETTEDSSKTTVGLEDSYSTTQETTEVPVYTTTAKPVTKETDSPYEETTEKIHKTTVTIENTYSTEKTTEEPVYTTTVKMETEAAVSPHEETTEENYTTTMGMENTYSVTEETTEVPVHTTTVKVVTKETDSPYEETTEESYKPTVVSESTPPVVETTEVPVYTSTVKKETEKTDLPYEATTEESPKTTISAKYPLSTVEDNTEVPVYTTTVETATEETVSPDAKSSEIGQQRSAEISEWIPSPKKTYRKGIVRREDAIAKRREQQRVIAKHSSSGSDLNQVSSSSEETGRGHTQDNKPEAGFENRLLRKLINMIVRELRKDKDAVSKEDRARLKEAFGDMWYGIVNEAFTYVPVQLPEDDVPKIASRVLEYLLKGTPLARRLETQSVKGRSLRSRRDTRRPRLEPWQEILLRAVMARPLTPTQSDEQKSQEILNAIKDQLQAPEEDLDFSEEDEETDDISS